jgi:hypothetical protein
MTNRGNHGKEEDGREGQKACREEGCEIGQEAREEVILPVADPGVDKDTIHLVGAGSPLKFMSVKLPTGLEAGRFFRIASDSKLRIKETTLPEGIKPEDVTVTSEYGEEDEAMRTVREVNEDPHDVLRVTVRKTIPAYVESITVNFEMKPK